MFTSVGVVIGYLPATEDEPVALWKVRGNRGVGENTTGSPAGKSVGMWSVDLDEEELNDAIKRWEICNSE